MLAPAPRSRHEKRSPTVGIDTFQLVGSINDKRCWTLKEVSPAPTQCSLAYRALANTYSMCIGRGS